MKRLLLLFGLITLMCSCKVQQEATADPNLTPDVEVVEEYSESLDERGAAKKSSNVPDRPFRGEEKKDFDLVHTRLEVSFDWEKRHLIGTARITLSPHIKSQDHLLLDAKGFDIMQIALLEASNARKLNFEYDEKVIDIDFDQPVDRKDTIEVLIKYVAKPYELPNGGSAAIEEDRGLYFINHLGEEENKPMQIWTQGETEANSCWFPTIDAPNQRTSQEMLITVNDRFKTLSNGELIYSTRDGELRTDYWKMDRPHAPYLFMMAIGEFAIVEDNYKELPLYYYVEPKYEEHAEAIFGNTPEMIAYLEEKLNYPYPWNKYAQVVVRDFVSGAMENTTASTFMEDVQVDSRTLKDYKWDYIIMHELMHQWFGDLVTCESWSNLPLNEAFANYSEYLWNEHKYGKDEADFNGQAELEGYLEEAGTKKVELIRYRYDDQEDMFDAHSYNKGGRVLHMLRRYLGDDAFFEGLNLYLRRNAFRDVEVHDLRIALEDVSGEDLNWFFDQWFLAAGHPQVTFSHTYKDGVLRVRVQQTQNLQQFPVFRLPTEIAWLVDGGVERRMVDVDQADETFTFTLPKKPDLVIFDPERELLFELEHEKSIDALRLQYRYFSNYGLRYEALSNMDEELIPTDSTVEVFIEALDDPFWAIRDQALSYFESRESYHEELLPRFMAIAKEDDNSVVQADALSLIADMSFPDRSQFFRQFLNDSSYSVVSAALYGYLLDEGSDDKMAIVESFESAENINLLVPVAEYYIQNKRYDKFGWLRDKMEASSGTETYYLLQFMGNMIVDAPQDTQQEAVLSLGHLASNHAKYYVRYTATRFLGMLEHLEGVSELISEIERNELDPRLQELYKGNR